MYRLYRHQAIALPWINNILETDNLENNKKRSAKRDQKPDKVMLSSDWID